MLNRKQIPTLGELNEISFVTPQKIKINDKVNLYWMKDVPNATSRIDFYFDAGTAKSSSILSYLTSGLLLSGNSTKNATQIHNELDNLGAYFDIGLGFESSIVTFYALNEQLPEVVKLFIETINSATFPQHEIDELINDKKQKLQINSEKVNFLAQRKFQQLIFDGTAYGKVVELSDFDGIQRKDIVNYFEKNYKKGLFKVNLVGDFDKETVQEIADTIAPWAKSENINFEANFKNKIEKAIVKKEQAIQTAIRIGKTLFNKNHPDYLGFVFMNTILGDFFGSRLMKNIREDKGYTYGIGSYINETKNSGYFVIGTEVGKDVCEATIKEIKFEIERLQNELITENELKLVQNYLLGQTLKSADGPYALMDLFLSVERHQLDLDFYNEFIHKIKTITREEIRDLAIKHLDWNSFTIVTAG